MEFNVDTTVRRLVDQPNVLGLSKENRKNPNNSKSFCSTQNLVINNNQVFTILFIFNTIGLDNWTFHHNNNILHRLKMFRIKHFFL